MIIFKKKPLAPATVDDHTPKPDAPTLDHEPTLQIKDFPQNYISYHIHKATAGDRPPRHHNVVHASDLDPERHWCAREPALLTLHDKKRPSGFLSTAQRMTFGMGYKGADLLIQMIPPEQVWGHWKCRACKHEMKFQYTPEKCAGCGGDRKALKYQEVLLRDPVSGIVGSVDLFVDILKNGYKTPVEIKTEGNDSFKARTKAEFGHEWRTMLYLWLIDQTPQMKGKFLNHQEGRVIYFTKEGYADTDKIAEWGLQDWHKTAIKEYWVTRNDDMVLNQIKYVQTYRDWRTAWDETKVAGVVSLPARCSKCTSMNCTRAKECPVRKECWK